MRKSCIILLILWGIMFSHLHSLYAQAAWSEIKVADVLSFQFPPTLELRDLDNTVMQTLQNGVNQIMISRGAAKSDYQVTLQPQGFNSQGSPLYARVIVNINADPETTGVELNGMTDSDVKEADALLKKQFTDYGLKGTWYGTTRRKYGGKYALVSRYDRVGLSGDVHVEDYRFFLKNYIVEIMISYRKSEFDHWNSDFIRIPLTLKFF